MSTIGERIRQLRGKQTLDEFSKHNGIHRVTLSRLEKGERTPDATFLQSVIRNTGICSEWLIMGTGQMYPGMMATGTRQSSCEKNKKASDTPDALDLSEYTQSIESIDSVVNKMSDMSEVLEGEGARQPIENTGSNIEFFSDTSEKLRLRQKLEQSLEKRVELQERLLSLTEQNADLRLQLKERDIRIRELERENAGLREALKGAAAVQREAAGWQAG